VTAADKQLTFKNLHYQKGGGAKTAPLNLRIRLIYKKLSDALKIKGEIAALDSATSVSADDIR
jgi:hypothetical protein